MTGVRYKKILQDALPLHIRQFENNSGGQAPVVVEDNAPCHTARVCREVRDSLDCEFHPHPA